MLQSRGLRAGEASESWNLSHPEDVTAIHRAYIEAGSRVITANTFGVNPLKYDHDTVERMVAAALKCVKTAIGDSVGVFTALDIGPTGRLLAPYGDLDFETAVGAFGEVARLGAKYGADLIIIETMNDCYETKAAVVGAKENCDLPLIVSNVYDQRARLLTGGDIPAMVAMLEGLGVAALGMNCSLGPVQMRELLPEMVKYASLPIIAMPNAGMPRIVDGRTEYDVTAELFGELVGDMARSGAQIVGGCCGTTPDYIRALRDNIKGISAYPVTEKRYTAVSSYTHAVVFGDTPVLIGERINPTGKPKLKKALESGDMGYILREGVGQTDSGADVIDVNVGLPGIDEAKMLVNAVTELQSVTDAPLQLDTSDPAAMEHAMRVYNGKPLVNSVNGKREVMDAVFPSVQKYGGAVIALTIDEDGIPDTAEGRLKIAERIVNEAAKYGIGRRDIIVDPLALTISSDPKNADITLESVKLITNTLGVKTSLGVSNVSFGLPGRDKLNSAFFLAALDRGLGCAIINPYSQELMGAFRAWMALHGHDGGFARYIEFAAPKGDVTNAKPVNNAVESLQSAIEKGLKDIAGELAEELVKTAPPLDVINNHIVPALNVVGKGFEDKTVYLPQLLMSAEAAQAAFEKVRAAMPPSENDAGEDRTIVLATVKGDIHDIGKNIVRALLENFGFNVIDLGRDVDPERVCQVTEKRRAPLVGLSALMTTTVPAMEATIKLLNKRCPWAKTVVGGAVLTKDYARRIGADFYAADAMETVRYAQKLFSVRS